MLLARLADCGAFYVITGNKSQRAHCLCNKCTASIDSHLAWQVNKGPIDVDQSALTGESLPVTLHAGSPAQMGSTVARGETNATVQTTGGNTFFGRTARLLQGVQSLGSLQRVLMRVVVILLVRGRPVVLETSLMDV